MDSLIGKLTEEEARELLRKGNLDAWQIELIIKEWKQKGYIKKDPVEENKDAIM